MQKEHWDLSREIRDPYVSCDDIGHLSWYLQIAISVDTAMNGQKCRSPIKLESKSDPNQLFL